MDSLTQLALGASVGEAVLGKQVGRRALVWGGICGTIPDLDSLIPFGDPVSDFTYHRAASHSMFFLTLLTPVMVWLTTRLHPSTARHWRGWAGLVWLAFMTHVLLDSLTVYGTQILLPFSDVPVAWGTIFIIDPLYTLPLLAGVLAALLVRPNRPLAYRVNTLGLVVSSLYLAFTLGAKLHVTGVVEGALASRGTPSEKYLAIPTPFNTLLWRVVVMDGDGYSEGFYSLLDESPSIRFRRYGSQPDLLGEIQDSWAVRRLQWFTKGFYAVNRREGEVSITDLRMGQEPFYVFSFKVGELRQGAVRAVANRRNGTRPPIEKLPALWRRIWDPAIRL